MKSLLSRRDVWGFLARVTLTHILTYVVTGVVFMLFLHAYDSYSDPAVSSYVRPTNDPIIMLGPLMQFVRGPIIALALYPFYDTLFRKNAWLLFGVLIGLMVVAAPGGILENLIYTKLPLWFQLRNMPEVVLQMLLFSFTLFLWERRVQNEHGSIEPQTTS